MTFTWYSPAVLVDLSRECFFSSWRSFSRSSCICQSTVFLEWIALQTATRPDAFSGYLYIRVRSRHIHGSMRKTRFPHTDIAGRSIRKISGRVNGKHPRKPYCACIPHSNNGISTASGATSRVCTEKGSSWYPNPMGACAFLTPLFVPLVHSWTLPCAPRMVAATA